jgi:hypothetical protein
VEENNRDELVALASFQGEYEAKIVQGILESGGIQTVVKGDLVQGVHPITVDGLGMMTIYVRRKDLAEAREVLRQAPEIDSSDSDALGTDSDALH